MLALEHLKSGRLSIQEIAFLLGYSDVANFRRAFKRWEGVAPSGVRGNNGSFLAKKAPGGMLAQRSHSRLAVQ